MLDEKSKVFFACPFDCRRGGPLEQKLPPEVKAGLVDLVVSMPEEVFQDITRGHTVESLKEKLRLATKGERHMPKHELTAAYFLGVKPDKDMCIVCGALQKEIKPTSMWPCGLCKEVYYCSVDCQRRHWAMGHMDLCVQERLINFAENSPDDSVACRTRTPPITSAPSAAGRDLAAQPENRVSSSDTPAREPRFCLTGASRDPPFC